MATGFRRNIPCVPTDPAGTICRSTDARTNIGGEIDVYAPVVQHEEFWETTGSPFVRFVEPWNITTYTSVIPPADGNPEIWDGTEYDSVPSSIHGGFPQMERWDISTFFFFPSVTEDWTLAVTYAPVPVVGPDPEEWSPTAYMTGTASGPEGWDGVIPTYTATLKYLEQWTLAVTYITAISTFEPWDLAIAYVVDSFSTFTDEEWDLTLYSSTFVFGMEDWEFNTAYVPGTTTLDEWDATVNTPVIRFAEPWEPVPPYTVVVVHVDEWDLTVYGLEAEKFENWDFFTDYITDSFTFVTDEEWDITMYAGEDSSGSLPGGFHEHWES